MNNHFKTRVQLLRERLQSGGASKHYAMTLSTPGPKSGFGHDGNYLAALVCVVTDVAAIKSFKTLNYRFVTGKSFDWVVF